MIDSYYVELAQGEIVDCDLPTVSDGKHGMLAFVPSRSLTVTMINVAGCTGAVLACVVGVFFSFLSLSSRFPSHLVSSRCLSLLHLLSVNEEARFLSPSRTLPLSFWYLRGLYESLFPCSF